MTAAARLGLPPRWDTTCHDEMTGTTAWEPAPSLTVGERAELERAAAAATAAFRGLVEGLSAALTDAVRAWSGFARALVDTGAVPARAPTDPAARALHHVRHRNTGPRVHADPRRNR